MIVVRRASREDAESILACLREAFEPFRSQYTDGAFADTVLTAETIGQRFELMSVFVAIDEKEGLVGTVSCSASATGEGHLRGMAVAPGWQGRGVADALLVAAEKELCRHGCGWITLDTTEPLQRAARFYRRHGYRPTGRVTDFYGMPLHEYSKRITPSLTSDDTATPA